MSDEKKEAGSKATPSVAEAIRDEAKHDDADHKTPGTFVLVLILLGSFAVYYFANWKALADTWHVR